MGAFEYTALDTAGREQNGVVEGDTVKHVRQLLRERQLLPVTVAEVKHGEAKRDRSFAPRRGVSARCRSIRWAITSVSVSVMNLWPSSMS